jgi:hypothetical protein
MNAKIDWTKPIEWFCEQDVKPAVLIGRYNERFVVGRGGTVALYCDNGTFYADQRGRVWIRNVPPPKVKGKVWFAMYNNGEDTWYGHFKYPPPMDPYLKAVRIIEIEEGEGMHA